MQNICSEKFNCSLSLVNHAKTVFCFGNNVTRFYLEGVVNTVQSHAAEIGEHTCDKFLQQLANICSIS